MSIKLGTFGFGGGGDEKNIYRENSHAQEPFSWRQDSDASFSDWTIFLDVVSGRLEEDTDEGCSFDENLQTEFNVHRIFLGTGPRRSLYFEGLVRRSRQPGGTIENPESINTSTVKLNSSAAKVFPIMLDYMYSQDAKGPLNVTRESAVPLRWLANRFGIEPMLNECSQFLIKDLSSSTAPVYLFEALSMCDSPLVEVATNVCIMEFKSLDPLGLTFLPPEDFSNVFMGATDVASWSTPGTCFSKQVAAYCEERNEDIPPDMFRTWMEQLSEIDSDSALSLLRYSDLYGLSQTREREKCLESASRSWEKSLVGTIESGGSSNDGGGGEEYLALKERTKIDLLERALMQAKNDLRATAKARKKREKRETEARIPDAIMVDLSHMRRSMLMDLTTSSFAHAGSAQDKKYTGAYNQVSWRQEPDESFSDWTIVLEIVGLSSGDEGGGRNSDEGDLQTEFNVHRIFLGAGQRRSLYFEGLFKCKQELTENLQSKSKVKVEVSAARAFPIMLDYMYSRAAGKPLNVTTDAAVALRWLANYFGIEPMFAECSKFLEKDLSISTALVYLREARMMCDEPVVESATNMCIKDFKRIIEDVEGLTKLSPLDFSNVLLGAMASSFAPDKVFSKLVVSYCDDRSEDVPPDMFQAWMEHTHLVDSDCAISLLRYSDLFGLSNSQSRERCLDAACWSWPSSLVGSIQAESTTKDDEKNYANLRVATKIELLERSLVRASDDLSASQMKLKQFMDESNSRKAGLQKALNESEAKLKEEVTKAKNMQKKAAMQRIALFSASRELHSVREEANCAKQKQIEAQKTIDDRDRELVELEIEMRALKAKVEDCESQPRRRAKAGAPESYEA